MRSLARRTHLEVFEDRLLMAIDGPRLLAAIPATGTVIDQGTTLRVAPREVLLRFDNPIDSASISNNSIRFVRSVDDILGNGNDITITPGFLGPGEQPNEVIVRFAENLPDDAYQMTIVGTGASPLRDTSGRAFNAGADLARGFSLDLAPQVVSVVPQPITRTDGVLSQAVNVIEVYFNSNDPLEISTATNRLNYQLIRTQDSATTVGDERFNPIVGGVTYDSSKGLVRLTFASDVLTAKGTYRLRIGTSEPLALPPVTASLNFASGLSGPGTSFDTAAGVGTADNPFNAASGTQTVKISDSITAVRPSLNPNDPSSPTVLFPGSPLEPGERSTLIETHVNGGSNTGNIPVIAYNFQSVYGTLNGQQQLNVITPSQRERVREVFSYYSYYLGVEFVETASSGWTIATGDPRVLGATLNVGGVAGGSLAIMNSVVDWGASLQRGSYFITAMHEIGHLLGLGHNYESPSVQGGGITDGVFPGDYDIIYGQYLWPALGNDINVYRFNLTSNGKLNIETVAERLRSTGLASVPSQLDTVITLYDSAGRIVARNDDYYGTDSFVGLDLTAGQYFVAITSTGNTDFDPRVQNSGFGGRTQGDYELRMTFTPTPAANVSIRDTTGNRLDGDNDGAEGGTTDFWFKVDRAHTLYVDKAATGGTGALGSITNPYTTIATALAAASQGTIVRIVGNGGADGLLGTVADNLSYNVGFNSLGAALSDGSTFYVPAGVTVMIDAGAIIKLRGANVDAGLFYQGISRAEGALQVLGTPAKDGQGRDVGSVFFTSYYNNAIGTDAGTAKGTLAKGNWGGLVFHDQSDLENAGIFLNYVSHAQISYGGGAVSIDSVPVTFSAIHLQSARPTILHNTISNSADSAISADPNSFQESEFFGVDYHNDYTRVGPRIYGNKLSGNSINGLFIRVLTPNAQQLIPLTVAARLANTDIVHVLQETLLIDGQSGGQVNLAGSGLQSRPSSRLAVDPGIVMKLRGGRIETEIGAQFIAEGTTDRPIIFTSVFDDRYGAGGTFDTTNDSATTTPQEGNWGGFMFGPTSTGSIDRALVAFAGGTIAVEGGFSTMNPVEIFQAKVRVTNSTFDRNAAPGGGDRNGRGASDGAVIYIRGAQPVILNNIFRNNTVGAVLSANVNALNSARVDDWGRSRGGIDYAGSYPTNLGPLIRNNLVGNNAVNGMTVRGGRVTTNSVWDDTDMVHVVRDTITLENQQSLTGTLRLQSSPTESLVVKVLGTNVDFIATGEALDIDDRTGGTLQIVGTPGHEVVITSLKDDTVGAGLTPQGQPQTDTLNRKGVVPPEPANLPMQGPIILDTTARDVHGSSFTPGLDGWDALRAEIVYIYNNSPNVNAEGILYVGAVNHPVLGIPYSREAIDWAAGQLGIPITYSGPGGSPLPATFTQFRMVYVASSSAYDLPDLRDDPYLATQWWGGSSSMLGALEDRQGALMSAVHNSGVGLLVMAQDRTDQPYGFVGDPFVLRNSGGNTMQQTTLAPAAFLNNVFNNVNYQLEDDVIEMGTPYLTTFEGPSGFQRLEPWAVEPITGEAVVLGLAPGGPGVGPPRDIVRGGDWGSVRLDVLSNDRNVDVINEVEQGFAPSGDTNNLPSKAQALGELAPDLVSGDDNVRLGFEVHGGLSQAANNPGGADVDVYSFRATGGTSVWLDIDRTASSLDTVIELVDFNGGVIARSDNSLAESTNNSLLVGIGRPMEVGGLVNDPSPFSTEDFYSSNPKDAGMRVSLPGTGVNTYFVRVRSSSGNLNNLAGGITKGAYVMQVRLREVDEFAGSTVRYADIRYAETGIEVLGKPERSPLLSNTVESNIGTLFFDDVVAGGPLIDKVVSVTDLGNLLETDRSVLNAGGTLTNENPSPFPLDPDLVMEVDWYRFELTVEQVQSIAGLNDGLKSFAAMFQINYADGLGRADTTMAIYTGTADEVGELVMIARDGEIIDSLPRPGFGGIGADTENLGHGSFGALDPTAGPIQLGAGAPGQRVIYYVAITSNAWLPEALTATLYADAENPLVRLEPLDSIDRVVDDRIGFNGTGITTGGNSQSIFPANSAIDLNAFAEPYHLGDVVLFINEERADGTSRLRQVNPFTGSVMTSLNLSTAGTGYFDIAMRNDGQLYALSKGTNPANSGNYVRLNTGNGGIISSSDDLLDTYDITAAEFAAGNPGGVWTLTYAPDNQGVQFDAMAFQQTFGSAANRRLFAFGSRDNGVGSGLDQMSPWRTSGVTFQSNILYELDPNTGAFLHGNDDEPFRSTFPGTVNGAPPPGTLAGTDGIPFGVANVTGAITGMTIVNNQMIVVTDQGFVYRIGGWNKPDPASTAGGALAYTITALQLGQRFIGTGGGGVQFKGLTLGPQTVEGGDYANTLFAIDSAGVLYAIDTNGAPKGVFLNGASRMATGVTDPEGLTFSTLDYNLWHATISRGSEPGHGISPSFNDNVRRTTEATSLQQLQGFGSYYFGLDPIPGPGDPTVAQPGVGAYSSNSSMYDTYALPGGAYGTLTSNTFSLEGYSGFDLPTLYFNYFLDTPDDDSETDATDIFRVFASTDGVNWELLTTNNDVDSETPDFQTVSGGAYRGQSRQQKVQETFDSTGFWRQARVDLGDYAGLANIRLRFQFSTAGSMGSNQSSSGTGDVLKAVPGSQLQDGQTFIINGQTFTFRQVPTTPSDVLFNPASTSSEVATQIAIAMDRVFAGANDDTNLLQTAKVVRDELRLFGYAVNSPGPMAFFGGTLPGDENGRFTSATRSRELGTFEGVYIDDIIVGFASRGEMVTGTVPENTSPELVRFDASPLPDPDDDQNVTGSYQLQIRPTQNYASILDDPAGHLLLNTAFDVNDRFADALTLVAKPGSQIADGATFQIDDGAAPLVFEFNSSGGVSGNNVPILFFSTDSAATIATRIAAAINNAVETQGFKVRASTEPGGTRVDLYNAFDAFNVTGSPLADVLLFKSSGDTRPWDPPGQTIIQNSTVSHSRQVGIQVTPKIGQIIDTNIAFTVLSGWPIGVPGSTFGNNVLPVLNTNRWMPGVTIKNNLVIHTGRTAIQVSGSPNTTIVSGNNITRSYALGIGDDFDVFVPFVRVVNNTVHDAITGIAAVSGASPSILNNIVSEVGLAATAQIRGLPGGPGAGLAVYVDPTSGSTVVGTSLYKDITGGLIGTAGANAILLQPNDPLFVDADNDNFYLAPDSMAIDSSINSLLERGPMFAVTEPLGFPPSPIQAPNRDLLGQLRVDDPSVPSPPGLGSDVFKDRGAIERADFIGPSVSLINPVDNDASGLDRNPQNAQVTLVNALLTDFAIQLLDGTGAGIDDSTAGDIANYIIERRIGNETVTLQAGVDYVLAYDTNNKIARLLPAQGLWINATYTIRLNNSAAGIQDLAGNPLQPNVAPNESKFIIQLTDTIASPWQNPNNRFDVVPDGVVTGRDLVVIVNRLLLGMAGPLPPVADVPPYIDVSGDGRLSALDALQVINHILTRESAQTAAPQAAESSADEEPLAAPAAQAAQANSASASDAALIGLALAQPVAAPLGTLPSGSAAGGEAAGAMASDDAVAQAVDAVLFEAPPADSALADNEEHGGWDAEWESILGDLSDDLRKRVKV